MERAVNGYPGSRVHPAGQEISGMPEKLSLKEALGMSEVARAGDLGKSLLAEGLGVLFINYFGCMSCIRLEPPAFPTNPLLIAFTFGLIVMIAVQALGHVSGAHLNPAVTFGAVVAGKVTIIRAVLYIIAQCLGAIAGTALLKTMTPSDFHASLGLTAINPNLSVQQAIGIEFFLGFILIFVVFGVTDPNKPDSKIPAALTIGLTVTAGHCAAIPFTGSSMNPARSLGSAVVANLWDNHWVYWLGPSLGGIAAALLYTYVFTAPPPTQYSPVQMKRLGGKEEEQP